MEERLIFSVSPLCPLAAEVIQNEDTIYFYLYDMNMQEERLEVRSACWLKNLTQAPKELDEEEWEDGIPPRMPKMYCKDPKDHIPYQADHLTIEWSKEGHIAALYDEGEIVSIIPSWAIPQEMSGYSVTIKSNSPFGWELTDTNALIPRLEGSMAYWSQDFQETWMRYSSIWLKHLESLYGESIQCYRLSEEGAFPTIFLMIYEKEGIHYAYTAGMGLLAKPNADQYFDEYEEKAYGEYSYAWTSSSCKEEDVHAIIHQMAGISSLPWQSINYLGHGHTVDFNVKEYPYAILCKDEEQSFVFDGQIINVERLISITEQEFQELCEKESYRELLEHLFVSSRLIMDDRDRQKEA